jgi:hypothetical protein
MANTGRGQFSLCAARGSNASDVIQIPKVAQISHSKLSKAELKGNLPNLTIAGLSRRKSIRRRKLSSASLFFLRREKRNLMTAAFIVALPDYRKHFGSTTEALRKRAEVRKPRFSRSKRQVSTAGASAQEKNS